MLSYCYILLFTLIALTLLSSPVTATATVDLQNLQRNRRIAADVADLPRAINGASAQDKNIAQRNAPRKMGRNTRKSAASKASAGKKGKSPVKAKSRGGNAGSSPPPKPVMKEYRAKDGTVYALNGMYSL